jgi:DNA repair protein RecN (Recombination protein N)
LGKGIEEKLKGLIQPFVKPIMIRELHIKNLALIEELHLELNSGFSVFTGETGAGKSILIGAIGLLLGERASTDLIRNGFDEAEVSGVFEFDFPTELLAELLEQLNIDYDGQLIIRRKITRNDRNRIHINQIPVSLNILKKIGDLLVDFHGQHEHQSLLNEENHLLIIDNLPEVKKAKESYSVLYETWQKSQTALEELQQKTRALSEKRDFLEYQFKELKSLELRSGEEDELESELSLLSSSTERTKYTEEILSLLDSSGDSIQKRISLIRKKLDLLQKYDPSFSQWTVDVENSINLFSELETFCSSYLSGIADTADPARIEHINSRLAKIQRLKKKYSCDVDKLIEKQNALQQDLASIENFDADKAFLEKKTEAALKECTDEAQILHEARKKASECFDKKITALMEKLGFKGGQLVTSFEPLPKPTPNGMELCRFLVRTNPGEPFLPLARTASGGDDPD